MLTGFSNILKNIPYLNVGKYVKALPWRRRVVTTEHFRIFYFFFTFVPVLFVCIFVQNKVNILKLMFMKEHFFLSFDISVKFGNFRNII